MPRQSNTRGYYSIIVIALYSILTIYCFSPCMSVLHDVFGRVGDPIAWYLPGLALTLRPAFINTLFLITRPHHIYSTALVIIILIDNLQYV